MNEKNNLPLEEPLYNIGVVTRVTGIPIATLHAWERRYNFPHSARTPGGHRLYTEKDIARLRWIKAQVDAGMQTRQAIQAVQHLDTQGRLPLTPATEFPSAPVEVPTPLIGSERLLETLLQRRLEDADRLMGEMLAFYSPEDLTLQVIGPTLADIGGAWAAGHISVADEHLASTYLRHRLLMWMVTGPQPHPINPTILACAPDEWHEGSLLMLGVLLRRQGWPIAYLGQSVPLTDLASFSQLVNPPAIVMVAMRAETAHNLMGWQKFITQTAGQPLVGFGGQAFVDDPDFQQKIQGIYLGATIKEGMAFLTDFLENMLPNKN